MTEKYDFIVLGGGGTGLAAAMYAARLEMKTLVLGFSHGTELPIGGVITTTHIVENYPGFKSISGHELAKKLEEHAKAYPLVKLKEEKVIDIKKSGKDFLVKTSKSEYSGKTILFATGTKWKKLEGVKGSEEFANRGVSYCALCQPPGESIVANSSLINIEKITPSTSVLTLDGSYQKIEGFSRRKYKGDLIEITPRFFTEPVLLTPEHPVLTIRADRGKSANYKITPDFSEPKWKEAGNITKDDCVIYPIIREIKDMNFIKLSDFLELREHKEMVTPHKHTYTAKILRDKIFLNKDLMRLVGYYLAEGSASGHTLRFYFNKKEKQYLEDVQKIIKDAFGLDSRIDYKDNVGYISLYSKVISDLFKVLFDKYSYEKKIPQFIFYLPEEKQTELVKGLWRGDGCTREKDFCLVTSSRLLAYQTRDILLRLGIIPSVQIRKKEELNKKPHKIEGRDVSFTKDKYHLTIGGQFLEKMGRILGIEHPLMKKREKTLKHAWIKDNFVILPVREIKKKPYEGDVLSISIGKNNNYVAKNFVVHNCDGPLFRNKTVAVVGGSDSAAKDALLLSEYAKKVHIIYRGNEIHPEPINFQRIKTNKKIEVINNTNIKEIFGDENSVKGVILDKSNKGSKELKLDGVFVAIGHLFLSELAKPLGVKLNDKGEIIINHATSETNIPGIYAAGDVTDQPFKQLITGVADGCVAAYSAYEHIKKGKVETV
ncbi:MAG: FAD-dependent oxidoreductase [Candidatus Pacearchaeota archaeon]